MKRLYRSRDNRMIAGVAGGLAAYLNVDPTIIRLLWVLALFLGVVPAIAVYVVGAAVIPKEPIL